MSQSGFTPIQLYRSATAATLPVAGNLAPGELAINTTDEKLYFENTGGTVTLLASSAAAGGTFTTVTATTLATGLGAVGTPAYTFTGDLNTGMWSPAAGNIAVSTGGVERMRIGSSGNVGIGTATPGSFGLLAAVKDATGVTTVAVSNGNAATNDGAKFSSFYVTTEMSSLGHYWDGSQFVGKQFSYGDLTFLLGSTPVERMRLTAAGNVGIGTSAPGYKLDVSSAGTTLARYTGAQYSQVQHSDGTRALYTQVYDNVAVLGTATSTPLTFAPNNTERMRIDSAGNVGIGTSAPGYKLDVSATGNISGQFKTSGSINALFLADAGTTAESLYVGTVGNDFRVVTGSNERMRVTAGGNVGIGTTAPSAQFAVTPPSNPTSATGGLQTAIGEASNNAAYQMRMGYIFDGIYKGVINTISGGVGADLLLNPSGGNVGIGTSAPAYKLQLSTDSAAKPSTNTWTIASDSRIKTETGEYTKGLDAVCALRPITYQYNGTAGFAVDGKENISIIAQEAMQHFPECVGTFEALLNEGDEEKTELFNWNGHALTFALVNAVKELKATNDALTARVAQLEGK